jgi:UDP-N-acetylmuramoylalanine--D-glutamate ligase
VTRPTAIHRERHDMLGFHEPARLELSGKRVAVLGLARTGLAAAEALRRHGADVIGCDGRPLGQLVEATAKLAEIGAEALGECTTLSQIGRVDLIVVSPGIPVDHAILQAARSAGVPVIAEIELAYRLSRCPIIAVSGTNGKGTTCTVLGDMLSRAGLRTAVAGNIGTPLVSHVETPGLDFVVAEISSFQLETVAQFRPAATILLNITPDHLIDRHGDFGTYVAAKHRMFENQKAEDFALLNTDDPVVAALAADIPARVLEVALNGGRNGRIEGGVLVVETEETGRREVCRVSEVALPGEHNLRNFLCAALAATLAGADANAIGSAIREIRPAKHLLTPVGEVRGVIFLDDSKATNPAAAVADLRALSGEVIVIAGGKDKGADFRELGDAISECAVAVFLIGETRYKIAAAVGGRVPMNLCGTLEDAVRGAQRMASAGATVVLLPACSSFDMFADYAARGDAFAGLVADLMGEAGEAS